MTIAIGVLSGGDAFVAADSQETVSGYWKRDQGKIAGHFRHGQGILVSGAGRAGYVDALIQKLTTAFERCPQNANKRVVEDALTYALDDFYARSVSPYQDAEALGVYMLIAARCDRDVALWQTDRNTITECLTHAAVGIGSGHALPILAAVSEHWPPTGLPTRRFPTMAAAMAAYVIYQVKRNVDGCGAYTDISWIGHHTGWLNRETSRRLDEHFRRYCEEIEPSIVRYLVGDEEPLGEKGQKALRAARVEIARRASRCSGDS